jgi:hypothetical protein
MVEKVSTLFQPFYPSAYSACRYVRFTAYERTTLNNYYFDRSDEAEKYDNFVRALA